MVNKILLPQEIETFYIIPTIRRHLAIYLQERGMKQKDVAAILGVNSATISQYKSNKRAHKVNFPTNVIKNIKISASKINDTFSYFRETQRLIELIRAENVLCRIHDEFSEVPLGCIPEKISCMNCTI